MTKAELVSKIAEKTGVEKLTTLAIVESMMNEIKNSISANEAVFLRGLVPSKQKREQKKRVEISRKIQLSSFQHIISLLLSQQKFLLKK